MLYLLLILGLGGVADIPDVQDVLDVRSSIGVNIHFTGAPARDLDLIRDAGFGWVRMDFVWSSIERSKGEYDFTRYDELVEGLSARGIRALFILDYSNRLYEEERSVRTAEGRKAFARFAGAAAGRYRGKGVRWEVWNEPNLKQFWSPQPAAEDYAALVIEAARAIRAADPDAVILAPACSGFPWEFLEAIFEKGVLAHIDEVSVHPYRSAPPETVRGDYERLRHLIAEHLPEGKEILPVVSGEWGYSTWHHGGKPFSAEVQGQYLARELLTNISEGIPLSIWYDWANDGPDPRETEHNFGTVTLDRKPKPAWLAARTLTAAVGKARFERRLDVHPEEHLLIFREGERRTLAAWTTGEPRPVVLYSRGFTGRLEVKQFSGAVEEVSARDDRIELTLDGGPRYVPLPEGTGLPAVHGIDVAPCERSLRVTARRVGEGRIDALLEVRSGLQSRSHEVTLEEGSPVEVRVPAAWTSNRPVKMEVNLLDTASESVLARRVFGPYLSTGVFGAPAGTDLSSRFKVALDGETEVPAEASLSEVRPDPKTDPPGHRALRLDYSFGEGWKFARIIPQDSPDMGRAVLSVWVKGDGSGNILRCRFRDAKGETFQPTAGPVNWKGWKRVEMALDSKGAGSWGGDGRVDAPIRWDSLFLLDSTRLGSRGTIEFAAPVLILGGR